MTRAEKIKALAELYEVSVQTIRLMIEQDLIEGAYAIKHTKKCTFVIGPELTEKLGGGQPCMKQ